MLSRLNQNKIKEREPTVMGWGGFAGFMLGYFSIQVAALIDTLTRTPTPIKANYVGQCIMIVYDNVCVTYEDIQSDEFKLAMSMVFGLTATGIAAGFFFPEKLNAIGRWMEKPIFEDEGKSYKDFFKSKAAVVQTFFSCSKHKEKVKPFRDKENENGVEVAYVPF
jgi:hypothetical protein